MATFTPPVLLPVPPHQNTQRYGLFNVATGPLDLPAHAGTGGVQYVSALCQLPGGYAVACTPGAVPTGGTLSQPLSQPFVVVSNFTCGAIGHTPEEFQQMAVQRLIAGEQAIVEKVFSNGSVGIAPSLANNNPNVTMLTAAANIGAAISALEGWLYSQYGPLGIIHIPISAANQVLSDYHVVKQGNVWVTQNGTLVSFGNYDGLAANGSAPATGHTTFYITGQMAIWREPDSDIFVSPWEAALNKQTNQVNMFAERTYALTYECLAAGIDVTLVSP